VGVTVQDLQFAHPEKTDIGNGAISIRIRIGVDPVTPGIMIPGCAA
jgi:hypothetical protein